MKTVLITGANSYIGTSFERFLNGNFHGGYTVNTVDMIDGTWREADFSAYDSVFHVAGIAHQKETKKNAPLYYKINCELAVETAKKAKAEGVKQFVFLSSMSVYGMDTGVITEKTLPNPRSHYARSKWEAEEKIADLANENFAVCILRPPMVYGKGCQGNFVTVKKLVTLLPFFPRVKNERSMVYIDNLASFVKLCIDERRSGVFFPQNDEYVSTVELARGIGQGLNKKIFMDPVTGAAVLLLRLFHPTCKKAFGSLIYDMDKKEDYCVVPKEESIKRSV